MAPRPKPWRGCPSAVTCGCLSLCRCSSGRRLPRLLPRPQAQRRRGRLDRRRQQRPQQSRRCRLNWRRNALQRQSHRQNSRRWQHQHGLRRRQEEALQDSQLDRRHPQRASSRALLQLPPARLAAARQPGKLQNSAVLRLQKAQQAAPLPRPGEGDSLGKEGATAVSSAATL